MAFAPVIYPDSSVTTGKDCEHAQASAFSALMVGYPGSSCVSSAAQFDQYSEYSEGCSDSEPVEHARAVRTVQRKSNGKCGARKYEDLTTSCGEDDLFQSADETTDFEPLAHGKRLITGESSTDVPPSGAELRSDEDSDSDADGLVDKPKAMTPFVYPLTLLLQVRALVAATTPKSCEATLLYTKQTEELALTTSPKIVKAKRVAPPRQGGSSEDKLTKSLRSILNGLTVDTMDSTLERLSGVGVQTVPQLVLLIREVVEKACSNQPSAAVCAELCVRIKSHRKFSSVAGADGEPSGFRQLLLDECWPRYQEFIKHCSKESSVEVLDKRHATGNVKFLGELMACGLVSPRLLINSAEGLLNAFLANRDALEALETLMGLLMAACPRLDVNRRWVHAHRMDTIFLRLREMVRKQSAPLAVRLLLRDVISLRDNGWCVDRCASHRSDELRTCVGRSVDREPPKPKQIQRHVEQPVTGKSSMLSLAREMLLAPVDAPKRAPTLKHHAPRDLRDQNHAKEATGMQKKENAIAKPKSVAFNPVVFHREVSVTLRDLGSDGNTMAAIQRIKAQNVPIAHQSKEYVDLLTRVVEISRKAVRHAAFAFAAGLVSNAFDPNECLMGVKVFFDEVYEDLSEDVPQLPTIIRAEFLPTLQPAFPNNAIANLLPEKF